MLKVGQWGSLNLAKQDNYFHIIQARPELTVKVTIVGWFNPFVIRQWFDIACEG